MPGRSQPNHWASNALSEWIEVNGDSRSCRINSFGKVQLKRWHLRADPGGKWIDSQWAGKVDGRQWVNSIIFRAVRIIEVSLNWVVDRWVWSCHCSCEHQSLKAAAFLWLRPASFTAFYCTYPFCFRAVPESSQGTVVTSTLQSNYRIFMPAGKGSSQVGAQVHSCVKKRVCLEFVTRQ